MKKDNIDRLFEALHSEFDFETPGTGHQERFLSKIKNQNNENQRVTPKKFNYWKPFIGIAASVLLFISVFALLRPNENMEDLAGVSPEMLQTQNFFTAAISEELTKLNKERTPETQALIDDAMQQMKVLEDNYESLKIDLTESGNDKRVIYAMISNFQTRIDLLKNVLETIEQVKQLKQKNNENSITI